MEMTGKERLTWLKQIKRIHDTQDKKREFEISEQLKYFNNSDENRT